MPRRLTLLCALLLSLIPASAADAARAPCRPDGTGPVCQVWTGKVTAVNDGDTVDVDINGDGKKRSFPIRFIGIQATELKVHSPNPRKRRGECHAKEATAFVEKLVRKAHGRVRLTSPKPRYDAKGRLLRSVNVRLGGHWVDLGQREMAAGKTFWLPYDRVWDRIYNELGQRAARKGIGIWDKTHCGVGPSQDVPLKLWVMSDPFGDETADRNGEWTKIQNLSTTKPISLAGWWVRDSDQRRFTFPAGTVIEPGQTVTLYAGRGRRTRNEFHWGIDTSVWENTVMGEGVGDGSYLFDPKGDLRAWMVYPCLVACSDPNQGAVEITANPRADENVRVRNVSSHAVDLYGYELRFPGGYAFPEGTVLDPGQEVRVNIQGSPSSDTSRVLHLGNSGPYMPDGGGSVELTTFDEIRLACDAWGSGHC